MNEIQRLMRAAGFSLAGIAAAFKYEAAFRLEVFLSFFIVPLALWLGHDGVEKAMLLGAWLLVPVVEILNSAIEATVDRIGAEQHELAGRAKDMGSAAVLLTCLMVAVVWLLILFA